MSSFEDTAVAAVKSIVQLLLVAGTGYVSHARGIITAQTVSEISKVLYELLLPALSFAAVASSISAAEMRELWILPVIGLTHCAIGFGLGLLVATVLRVQSEFYRPVVASLTVLNGGYLPLSLLEPVIRSGTFDEFYPELSTEELVTRMEGQVLLYAMVKLIVIGIIGELYLNAPTAASKKERKTVVPVSAAAAPATDDAESNAAAEDEAPPAPPSSALVRIIRAPPLIGCFLGILVGLISPVQDILYKGNDPVLSPLAGATDMLARGTVGLALIVLGANIHSLRGGSSAASRPVVAAVAVAKLLVAPAIGFCIGLGIEDSSLVRNDPLLLIELVLPSASPSAVNLVVFANVSGADGLGETLASLMVAQYFACSITVTLFMALCLDYFL